ncbi:MAG: C39 family peptidase [Oscillospiraceae bacterium]
MTRNHRKNVFTVMITVTIVLFAVVVAAGCENEKMPERKLSASYGIGEKKVTESKIIDAPYINQCDEFPTGCESVSTVMALQYLGIDISVDEFVDNYLDMEEITYKKNGQMIACNPWKAFPGNPRSETGFGCYSPVIKKAVDSFIDHSKYRADILADMPIEDLCKNYIDRNTPVVIWATIDMKAPRLGKCWTVPRTNEKISWIAPQHCLLLVGYDKNYYYFNDPWRSKKCKYPKEKCDVAYKALFSQAVVITKNQE